MRSVANLSYSATSRIGFSATTCQLNLLDCLSMQIFLKLRNDGLLGAKVMYPDKCWVNQIATEQRQ
jgi:hypothetical protein